MTVLLSNGKQDIYIYIYKCPSESEPWVFYRGAEYLLAKQPFDWDAVSLACQMMGAHLLSIHSREEMHFLKERLQRVCSALLINLRSQNVNVL